MIIKTIIFIIIAYLIQLSSNNWYNILFFSAIIGVGSNSYKQSIYLGSLIGGIPWLIKFIVHFNHSQLLLSRISSMLGINNSIILIGISILFISSLTLMTSTSIYHIKIYSKKIIEKKSQ